MSIDWLHVRALAEQLFVALGAPPAPVEASFITKFYKTTTGSDVRDPLPTITAGGWHLGEVRAFLVKYYSARGRPGSQQQSLFDPIHTVTTKARFGLVTVAGEEYAIVDIGMRMLAARELFNAQGLPRDYIIELPAPDCEGSMSVGTFTIAGIECHPRSLAERYELLHAKSLGCALGLEWKVAEGRRFSGAGWTEWAPTLALVWRDAHRWLAAIVAERAKEKT